MQRFKQTWLTVGDMCRWVLEVCVSARCQREAIRRQRLAQCRMASASSTFVFAVQRGAYMLNGSANNANLREYK